MNKPLNPADTKTGPVIDWGHQDVDIQREGKMITLPAEPGPMPIDEAIKALKRKQADEEQIMDIMEDIVAFPLEGAVAFIQAMRSLYGWASPIPTPGFFGPIPPDMLTVEVNFQDYIQIPWGAFTIPGIERPVQLGVARKDGQLILRVTGQARKREQHILLELAKLTREILRTHSIYRGKALRIQADGDGTLDMSNPPKFLDLRGVDGGELILSKDVAEQINVNILAPIRNTAACRQMKIPLKRGVLLSGRYGVGKTMTTRITAKECVDNGWTFIMVDRANSLKEALLFAQRYQPSVVFCEDIDRVVAERDEQANDLLNIIDGILGKNTEVMVVLTTNHVEKIEQAMLRPGRLDAVITVTPPDGEAVQRLIRLYSRGLLREGEPLDEVGEVLAGNIPAVIREVTERAKLAMIAHDNTELTQEDLLVSARGMREHLDLLKPKVEERNVHERLGIALAEVVQQALGGEDFIVGDNGQLERIEKRVIRATDVTADGVRTLRNDIAKTQKGVNEVGSSVLAVHETAKDIREQL